MDRSARFSLSAGVTNCFSMGALRTSDGGWVMGVMAPHTSAAGKITNDFFNAFNHPIDNVPNASTGLQDLSTQTNDPRIIQFSLHQPLFVVLGTLLFAASGLFAFLNLDDSELLIYERLYSLLAESVPRPDLVVYLQAPTEILLRRIRTRGRPEEARLSEEYLAEVNRAYNHYFFHYGQTPLLVVNTADADFVKRAEDLDDAMARFRSGDDAYRYSVAWIDCLSSGAALGRSVLLEAGKTDEGDPAAVDLKRLDEQTPDYDWGFRAATLQARVSRADGTVSFLDARGQPILAERAGGRRARHGGVSPRAARGRGVGRSAWRARGR